MKEVKISRCNTSKLIDPIFVSNSDLVLSCGTQSADTFSDHRLVFAELNLKHKKMKLKLVTYRCFKNFVVNDFLHNLESVPWINLVYENNIGKNVELFNNLMNEVFDKHAPIKTVRVTKTKADYR